MRERHFYTYLLTNLTNTTLYTGVTNNLCRRVWEHKEQRVESFPKTYNINRLVYYELHYTIEHAIIREKRIKRWNRDWKEKLITDFNPQWVDLYDTLVPDD